MADYREQWRRYKVRERWIVAVMILEFVGFLPFIAVVSIASKRLIPGTDVPANAAIVGWMALFLFTGTRLRTFRCPRCGKNFSGGIFGDIRVLIRSPKAFFGKECVYCGLPMGRG
jgi:hypothetical protein